jgi:hypothetical protein
MIKIPLSIPSSSQDIVVSGESHSLRCTDFVLNRSEAESDYTITTAGFEGYGIKEVVETVKGEACCQVPGTASLLSYLLLHLDSSLGFASPQLAALLISLSWHSSHINVISTGILLCGNRFVGAVCHRCHFLHR